MTPVLLACALLAHGVAQPEIMPREETFVDRVVACRTVSTQPLPFRTRNDAGTDPWLGLDKVRHFAMAFTVTGFTHAALRTADLNHDWAVAGSALGGVAAGLAKELYDVRAGKGFSVRDLVWDLAGTAVAAVLVDRTR